MEFPAGLKYTKDHEWAKVEGAKITVGITAFAVEQLGDITLVNLDVKVGDELAAGKAFGTIESVKTLSDLMAPIAGKVVAINKDLDGKPELVNEDCYGKAWMIVLEAKDTAAAGALLDAGAYTEHVKRPAEKGGRGIVRQLQVPGYEVWGLLGEGGMSEVWLAKHEVLAAPVIVKTLRQALREGDGHGAAARILSEARLMARVSSTRIVRALDAGELPPAPTHPALPFMVQEYVDGLDLAELDRRRRSALGVGLPLWMVCHVMRETCMALRSAHQAGVIHRDLKPSNVFGEPENGIRLGDFGIAVARTASARSEKSSAGTLPFMAPEQLRGSDEIGRFTDVWGAAATACDLRYGRSPFDSVGQILDERMPPALPAPASPAEAYFQDVLRRMLTKNWQERPQDILGPLAHFTMLARAIEPASLLTSRHRDSIQLGPTRVSFVVGDIADAEADAIVSSANFEMKMRTGGSEALRLRGGDALEEEAMSGGEQALGTCLRTTPGKLKTKHLFHAVSAWNEVSCVGRSFTRALLLAEESSCATLAAPALGTGVAKVGLEACANAMMTTLRWHLMLGGSRLRELTIVLYTEEKRRLFQEVAEEVLGISRWRSLPADLGLPDDRSVIPDGTSPTFLDPHRA